MENAGKKKGKTTSAIRAFFYQLKALREHYFAYEYLVFIVQLLFVTGYPFLHSIHIADPLLAQTIKLYQSAFMNSSLTVYLIFSLAFAFAVLAMLALLSLYTQSHLQYSSKLHRYYEKARKFYLSIFFAFEIIVLPSFILCIQNIVSPTTAGMQVASFIILPIATAMIVLERERRLFQIYLFAIQLFQLILYNWTPLLMGAVSVKLAINEHDRLKMKIVYYQLAIWNALILVSKFFNQPLSFFHLSLSLVAVMGIVLLNPQANQNTDLIKANRQLINLTEIIVESKEITLEERIVISREVANFKEELLTTDSVLSKQEQIWLKSQFLPHQEQMSEFLALKIAFELKRQYSNKLKMQQLECQVRFSAFNMKTLYEIEKFIQEIKIDSTYQDQEKLNELVNLTGRKFLKKSQKINALTIIQMEKETERLYQSFINMAIVMQEFWISHGKGQLTEVAMQRIMLQMLQLEEEADRIIKKISKYNCVRHELIVYQFMKRLNDNSHKSKEPNAFGRSKDDIPNTEYMNYILVEKGKILDMSNRLLNEFQLTKKEASELQLGDIVNKHLHSYLTLHLDKLIEKQVHKEQANFILPLCVSRQHPYIQPYKVTIELLPELQNGIKYILHLERATQLQKVPFFLYSSKIDRIVGITKNFKRYFAIENDHYIFRNYAHELFNVDILSVYNQNKEFKTIICEFNAHHSHSQTKAYKNRKAPVILKNIKQYEMNNENLILLSIVKRQDFDRTELTNLISQKLLFIGTNNMIVNVRAGTEESNSELNDSNFCKISNPYENHIDQKISKMSQFYRVSYLKCIIFLNVSIVLVLIASIITMFVQISLQSSNIVTNFDNNTLSNEEAINILQLYTHSSIIYQLNTYPHHFLQIQPNFNISTLIYEYSLNVDQDIKSILTSQIQSQPNYNANQSLLDIAECAKKALINQQIAPFIQTWPAMKNRLSNETGTAETVLNSIKSFVKSFSIFCFALIAILILFVEIVSYKIQEVENQIHLLYQSIDLKHSQKYVRIYRLFAHELYSSIYFRGVKSDAYLKNYQHKKSLQNIQETSTLQYLQNSMKIDLSSLVPTSKSMQSSSYQKDCHFSFFWKESYICIPLFLIVCFLHSFLYYAGQYKAEYTIVQDHSAKLYKARGNISSNAAYFMVASLQQILPFNERLKQQIATQTYLQTEITTPLPAYYSQYSAKQSEVIKNNFCFFLSYDHFYSEINCSQVFSGNMGIGYAQTVTMYNNFINTYIFTKMSDFNETYRPSATYPIFIEVMYTKIVLLEIITNLQTSFIEQTRNYLLLWNQYLLLMVKLGWLLVPIFLAITTIFYMNMRRKCSLCLKLFFILPRQYLLEMRVTKILRKKSILDHIQKLAF